MSGWTEERVEALRKLWNAGFSASQVARELGGVTRNAVIGKVVRLGLAGRADPARPGERIARAPKLAKPKPAKPPRPIIVAGGAAFQAPPPRPPLAIIPSRAWRPLPGSNPRPLIDAGNRCKWPVDVLGADQQHACCEPRKPDHDVYCEPHAALSVSSKQPAATKKGRENELIRATRRFAA